MVLKDLRGVTSQLATALCRETSVSQSADVTSYDIKNKDKLSPCEPGSKLLINEVAPKETLGKMLQNKQHI